MKAHLKISGISFLFVIKFYRFCTCCRRSTETGEGILQILFGLVHQLLADGELMLARTMRKKVLEKCAHHRAMRDASKPLLSSIHVTSRLGYRGVHSMLTMKQLASLEKQGRKWKKVRSA